MSLSSKWVEGKWAFTSNGGDFENRKSLGIRNHGSEERDKRFRWYKGSEGPWVLRGLASSSMLAVRIEVLGGRECDAEDIDATSMAEGIEMGMSVRMVLLLQTGLIIAERGDRRREDGGERVSSWERMLNGLNSQGAEARGKKYGSKVLVVGEARMVLMVVVVREE
ncbi:hypothetical protein BDQ17DRAFT_1456354 [Cyathus striatus]|nr:hypothetical protein BDQ17DRAFT_1456354 [Cyathus striatus]